MTDYCTVENTEKWFPGTAFDSETKLKSTQIGEFITGHSAAIDSRINALYETPITGTVALAIVKDICEWMSITDMEAILLSGLGARGENLKPIDYYQRAMDKLDMIESGELDLTDAVKRSAENNFYNDHAANSREFVMKMGVDQW